VERWALRQGLERGVHGLHPRPVAVQPAQQRRDRAGELGALREADVAVVERLDPHRPLTADERAPTHPPQLAPRIDACDAQPRAQRRRAGHHEARPQPRADSDLTVEPRHERVPLPIRREVRKNLPDSLRVRRDLDLSDKLSHRPPAPDAPTAPAPMRRPAPARTGRQLHKGSRQPPKEWSETRAESSLANVTGAPRGSGERPYRVGATRPLRFTQRVGTMPPRRARRTAHRAGPGTPPFRAPPPRCTKDQRMGAPGVAVSKGRTPSWRVDILLLDCPTQSLKGGPACASAPAGGHDTFLPRRIGLTNRRARHGPAELCRPLVVRAWCDVPVAIPHRAFEQAVVRDTRRRLRQEACPMSRRRPRNEFGVRTIAVARSGLRASSLRESSADQCDRQV
jgi:hypothetical protein